MPWRCSITDVMGLVSRVSAFCVEGLLSETTGVHNAVIRPIFYCVDVIPALPILLHVESGKSCFR